MARPIDAYADTDFMDETGAVLNGSCRIAGPVRLRDVLAAAADENALWSKDIYIEPDGDGVVLRWETRK